MSATVFRKPVARADTRQSGPASSEVAAPEVLSAGPPDEAGAPSSRPAGRWRSAVTAVFRHQPATGSHRAARRWRFAWRAGTHRGD